MNTNWSNTDFPYMCLKDEVRTKTFRKAIQKVIKKNDIVIDVGSGSGILSFFAVEAGAKKVYAVEIDRLLAQTLRKSISINDQSHIIEVIQGDIFQVKLPKEVNVVISEMIDTGLLDELQLPILNHLKKSQVITEKTRLIPCQYKTYIQLIDFNNSYYGYQIVSPKHEWPFYSNKNNGWLKSHYECVSDVIEINNLDFSGEIINERVNVIVSFNLNKNKKANAIKLSGLVTLVDGVELGSTNAFNGDKIISIETIQNVNTVDLKITYQMGEGLRNLSIEYVNNKPM